ncbi:MAG: hypothetical protein AAF170_09225 [Bacteroidota bacterium]
MDSPHVMRGVGPGRAVPRLPGPLWFWPVGCFELATSSWRPGPKYASSQTHTELMALGGELYEHGKIRAGEIRAEAPGSASRTGGVA